MLVKTEVAEKKRMYSIQWYFQNFCTDFRILGPVCEVSPGQRGLVKDEKEMKCLNSSQI